MQEPSAAWRRRSQPLLGTYVEIAVPATDEATLRRWTDPAFARIADFHRAMSFHEAGSDLSRLARVPAGGRLQVGADTWATLQAALEIALASGGLYDPATGAELVRRGLRPAPAAGEPPPDTSAGDALRLAPGGWVEIKRPVWLDLGGIAKGAAVDAAVDALRAAGAPSGLVNAGGDLRVYGSEAHAVSIAGPAGPVTIARIADGAFAGSSTLDPDGRPHVVAPASATPWPRCHAVAVAASTARLADALTKVAMLGGPRARPVLRGYDARAVWIDADGCLHHVR